LIAIMCSLAAAFEGHDALDPGSAAASQSSIAVLTSRPSR